GAGRADDRTDQRAVAGGESTDARRRGEADRGLRLVVELHWPFHPRAVLLLRLRLRGAAGAGAVPEVQAGGTGSRATVPGDGVVGRLRSAARAGGQARRGRERSGVLGAGVEVARRHGDRGGVAGSAALIDRFALLARNDQSSQDGGI